MTLAPLSFATCNAARDTPPPMPHTSTVSPGRTCARVTTIRQAVRVTSENAAASAHVSGVGDFELVEAAGTADHPGAHGGRPSCYGMNAGDTICSAPVVGMGTGAPLPADPTGCTYTLNTFFCTATTSPRRSPAADTEKS